MVSRKKASGNSAALEKRRLLRDAGNASDAYTKLGLDKPLSRMDPTVPTDMSNLMGQMNAQLDPNGAGYVGARSQQMKDVLARMEGGLSGLTSPEMQAMREQAMGEISRQRMNAMSSAAAASARSGVRGAAASAGMRDLDRDTMRSQQSFENQLLTDNAGIQDSRLQNYTGALKGAENDEYGKVSGLQKSYADIIGQRNSYVTDANKFNATQEGTDRAARAAGLFGLMQYSQAGRLGNKQMDIAAKNAGRVGGGTPGPSPDLINALQNIYKQRFGDSAQV